MLLRYRSAKKHEGKAWSDRGSAHLQPTAAQSSPTPVPGSGPDLRRAKIGLESGAGPVLRAPAKEGESPGGGAPFGTPPLVRRAICPEICRGLPLGSSLIADER